MTCPEVLSLKIFLLPTNSAHLKSSGLNYFVAMYKLWGTPHQTFRRLNVTTLLSDLIDLSKSLDLSRLPSPTARESLTPTTEQRSGLQRILIFKLLHRTKRMLNRMEVSVLWIQCTTLHPFYSILRLLSHVTKATTRGWIEKNRRIYDERNEIYRLTIDVLYKIKWFTVRKPYKKIRHSKFPYRNATIIPGHSRN